MTHIFISYAKKDTKSLAMDLADKLNALEGVSAWVDVEGIDYGDEWETLIQRQIARCDYMVVLYSPDINRHIDDESQSESYVIKEIRYAQMRGKTIIPVMAQKTHPPMGLISNQYIDYAKEEISSVELVNRLCKRMKITPTSKTGLVSVTSSKPKITIPPKPKIILPQPFDWCYIPAGKVILTPFSTENRNDSYIKQEKVVDVSSFWMSKYPITNAQFRKFVEDSGYQLDTYWVTENSKEWLKKNKIKLPHYWNEKKWNGDDFPVVGVTYYEALAFCLWLSSKSDKQILIPTDPQWQRAMQGDDNRLYPWGNDWDKNKCNVSETQIGKTTTVNFFEPKGNSPYNVVDMAGNVWHWCLTCYESGENDIEKKCYRVLHGSSWNGTKEGIPMRHHSREEYAWEDLGFSIVCL